MDVARRTAAVILEGMHYKDGQEVKLGDRAKFPLSRYDGATGKSDVVEAQGIVVSLAPGATTCNVGIAYPYAQGIAGGLGFVSMHSYTTNTQDCELVHRF